MTFRFLPFMCSMLLSLTSVDVHAEWVFEEHADDFSDEERSYARPDSVDLGKSASGLLVAVKCEEDGLNFLLLHSYVAGGDADQVVVELRVDKNPPYGPRSWSLQGDHKHSYMPMAEVPDMIGQMTFGSKLAIRISDPSDGEVTTQSVLLGGFHHAVSQLGCHKS